MAAAAAVVAPPAPAPVPRQYPPSAPRRFDGKHKEYLQFQQMFQNTIGASGLSNVEKLSRLLGLLDGEPRRLLAGLLITDGNYAIALDTLQRRYGDSGRTARELKSELSSLISARSTAEVREFQITVESLVQQLESLGHPPASEETIWNLEERLPRRCLDKLMDEQKRVEARLAPDNVWDLSKFCSSLEEIVKQEEKIGGIMYSPQSTSQHPGGRSGGRDAKKGKKSLNAAGVKVGEKVANPKKISDFGKNKLNELTEGMNAAKVLARNGARAPNEDKCLFCQGKHKAYLCPLSIDERRNKVSEAKGCWKCLRPGHWASNCNAEPCRRCSQGHHTYLCKNDGKKNPNNFPRFKGTGNSQPSQFHWLKLPII